MWGDGIIKPVPERVNPLQEMQLPKDIGALNRASGMFAYYTKWIPNFLDKIHLWVKVNQFPQNEKGLHTFELLKYKLCRTTLWAIEEKSSFEVDCDALNNAISVVLRQNERPVAFMSKLRQVCEKWYIVKKEALAIIIAIRKQKYLLPWCHFKLYTDARSVSYVW